MNKYIPYSDMAKEPQFLADHLFNGVTAEAVIVDELDEKILGFECDKISWDHYDDSLEIYVNPPEDWELTSEMAIRILGMGFSRFWVNFYDGTEQYCQREWVKAEDSPRRIAPADPWFKVYERKPVPHPKYKDGKPFDYTKA